MRRKKLLVLLVAVVVLALVASGCILVDIDDDFDHRDYQAHDSFSFTVPVNNRAQLRLISINGNVEILGNPTINHVLIEGEKRVSADSRREAEDHLRDIDIDINEQVSDVVVRSLHPRHDTGRNYAVDYVITLPADFRTEIDLVNGNIDVKRMDNRVVIANVNGNIELVDHLGSATVALTNGNIDADVSLPDGGVLALSTVNGNLDVNLPRSTSAEFSAALTHGNIRLSNLVLSDRVETSRTLKGRFGLGDGTITLQTVNGNIRVEGY